MADDLAQREVEAFLFREARYCDDHEYEQWLELWTDDGRYWVPANHDAVDPSREVSIVYDDRSRLTERVLRLRNPATHSQDPPSRLSRVVSNVEFEPDGDGGGVARARFVLVETRRGVTSVYGGKLEHVLRRVDGGLRMAWKKVFLTNLDQPLGNLTFLL